MSASRPTDGDAFRTRLGSGPPLLLDGALGTELERRGIPSGLPLWSTHALLEAPGRVEEIHRDYVRAGAEIVTANTFRTQRRTLDRAGLADRARELSARAVALARSAAGSGVFVAGSVTTLEDCYRPDRVPDDASCAREHREHVLNLADAGVDVIAVETMNCVREAQAAARAASETGLPFWVSFVCDGDARLLSGEPLARAVEAVRETGPSAMGANCAPADTIDACLNALLDAFGDDPIPLCVYPNLGAPLPDGAFRTHDCTPDELAARAVPWLRAGVRIVGGCCGTRPEHVAALAATVAAASERGSA